MLAWTFSVMHLQQILNNEVTIGYHFHRYYKGQNLLLRFFRLENSSEFKYDNRIHHRSV